ncbi:helix-turn-helix transcriptional regulator [uncultured Roseobacter sp.]|uniref:helix-turn-helix domain-containing protein n=1 Tax=uncultured Roseobacter sp. TaxID=114847 RepID=UPI002607E21E|nr:helix-turn-helix transcriptional regulator [uncultured Roseobacter sp.]
MSGTNRTPAQLRNMFGANLRFLAADYPSISALSRELGINRTQFNRYLSGESFPRPDVLSRICDFFGVDARVLLEPVEEISSESAAASGYWLREFMGETVRHVPEEALPGGFYHFTRRSFVRDGEFVRGLAFVQRVGSDTYLRGYEPKMALAMQGIPASPSAREFRGFVLRIEDGLGSIVTRRHGMTGSFNYLTRVTSFQNNFWVGYVARTVRETSSGTRMTRLVYEHIGNDWPQVMQVARSAGFCSFEELLPFHQRLLQPEDPFR